MLTSLLPRQLLAPGTPAPDFRLLDTAGRSVGLEDLRARRGVVLLFFTSDRFPEDLNVLKQYAGAWPDFEAANIALLGLCSLDWETLHQLAERLNLPFSVLFDGGCRYAKRYRAVLIPKHITGRAVYVLNGSHEIVAARRKLSPKEALSLL